MSPSSQSDPSLAPAKRRPLLMKQANMRRVLYALSPVGVSAVYFFGWRVAAVLGVVFAAGLLTEYITSRQRGQPVSTACLVTCLLYGLSLPPTVPFWVAAIGAIVGILFGKEVFGGFGRNFANPAIVGRAFVYICFPVPLTAQFVPAFQGFPGGLVRWSWRAMDALPAELAGAGRQVTDAVTQATPLFLQKTLGTEAALRGASWWNMALGNVGGVFEQAERTEILAAGSMGEGCAILIVLAGAYLFVTKTANWRLSLSALLGVLAATGLFRHVLGFDGSAGSGPEVPPALFSLLAGTTLYVIVFMVTDPVSAPKKPLAQYAYGGLIGLLIVLLRWRSVFTAAATFAVLLGNCVAPLLEMGAEALQRRRKARAAGEEPAKEAGE